MIYLYLFGTCFHFIYVFMIIGNKWKNHTTKSASSYRTSCSFICQYNDAPPYKSDIQAIE